MDQSSLMHIYRLLWGEFGDRGWWPADDVDEMIIGAILVQNVAWTNVERAITLLRQADLLSLSALSTGSLHVIEECVRSTRFYRSKAERLQHVASVILANYPGGVSGMFLKDMDSLRKELLSIRGIGPETADDIVLYGAGKPSFVVDAYTMRIFERIGWFKHGEKYESARKWFMDRVPQDVVTYQHFHALIVALGHHYCLPKNPRCETCPLGSVCSYGKPQYKSS